MPELFEETRTLAEATTGAGRRRVIQLIDAGWSKNGRYYGPATLREAATQRIFPAGTPMFVDHPTLSESAERPERSIKDLAARLATDARFTDGRLVAEADLFGPWEPVINDLAEHIGVSIRAAGTLEYGEAEGQEGPIVTAITEGISVDFVTAPARGGKILALVEAARGGMLSEARNIGQWLESRLHLSFTQLADDMFGTGRLSRDERIALSSAVGDALAAFVTRVEADQPQLYQRDLWEGPDDEIQMGEAARAFAEGHGMTANDLSSALSDAVRAAHGGKNTYAWICDNTDEWVVYRVDTDTGKGGGLYQQTYTVADGQVTLTGKPAEVTAHTTYTPAGQPPAASQGTAAEATQNAPGSPPADVTPTKEEGMPELTEAEARALTESRDAALAEAEKARAEADAAAAASAVSDLELARFRATEAARPIAATLLAESGLPAPSQTRLLAAVIEATSVPLTDAYLLNGTLYRAQVAEAIKTEQTYVASLREADGQGQPRGLGDSTSLAEPNAETTAKTTDALVESFKANGMSEAAARLAATGRPF